MPAKGRKQTQEKMPFKSLKIICSSIKLSPEYLDRMTKVVAHPAHFARSVRNDHDFSFDLKKLWCFKDLILCQLGIHFFNLVLVEDEGFSLFHLR